MRAILNLPVVLVVGVNPFEDLPGYQLVQLLSGSGRYRVVAADDSQAAVDVLQATGNEVEKIPHPSLGLRSFGRAVVEVCGRYKIDVVLAGNDATLYALLRLAGSMGPIARCTSYLGRLREVGLSNKWGIQEWVGRFVATPKRLPWNDGQQAGAGGGIEYPLMVKGLRKGALKCSDELEALVARRALLKNPANQGKGGGVYLEEFVEGREHSIFFLFGREGNVIASVALRKLATTQSGTTMFGEVESVHGGLGKAIERLGADISGPAVIELEWREAESGPITFEANLRFPSWIGAMRPFGCAALDCFVGASLREGPVHPCLVPMPPGAGTVFARLPQARVWASDAAGNLATLGRAECGVEAQAAVIAAADRIRRPLWRALSPHQFQVK